jgi:hypothetical protein
VNVEDRYPALSKRFLARLSSYFGISGVKYAESGVHDIAVIPATKTILLGRVWRESDDELKRSKLVHEMCHLAGYPHDPAMRALGYFSRPERDTLSKKVYAAIKRGDARFDPPKFGLPAKRQAVTRNPLHAGTLAPKSRAARYTVIVGDVRDPAIVHPCRTQQEAAQAYEFWRHQEPGQPVSIRKEPVRKPYEWARQGRLKNPGGRYGIYYLNQRKRRTLWEETDSKSAALDDAALLIKNFPDRALVSWVLDGKLKVVIKVFNRPEGVFKMAKRSNPLGSERYEVRGVTRAGRTEPIGWADTLRDCRSMKMWGASYYTKFIAYKIWDRQKAQYVG